MPVMDGFEATKRIKKLRDKSKANIPIIALSANADKGCHEACINAGMKELLLKPISVDKLISTLQRCTMK